MILNDSSLFSNSADITTKEILKRYGDRAKAPVVNSPTFNSTKPDSYGDASSPVPPGQSSGGMPIAHRVDPDPNMMTAWQNESSVRHVGSDAPPNQGGGVTPPNLPYAQGRHSQEGNGSPNRGMKWDKQRPVGMA